MGRPHAMLPTKDFYPRPPRGGRRRVLSAVLVFSTFLPTPSTRRATCSASRRWSRHGHFYPRPPRGGRRFIFNFMLRFRYFYPRPPRGGRRRAAAPERGPSYPFLPTPSTRRATGKPTTARPQPTSNFYPRPPRGGRHVVQLHFFRSVVISTHALHEEGDPSGSSGRTIS